MKGRRRFFLSHELELSRWNDELRGEALHLDVNYASWKCNDKRRCGGREWVGVRKRERMELGRGGRGGVGRRGRGGREKRETVGGEEEGEGVKEGKRRWGEGREGKGEGGTSLSCTEIKSKHIFSFKVNIANN